MFNVVNMLEIYRWYFPTDRQLPFEGFVILEDFLTCILSHRVNFLQTGFESELNNNVV